MVKVQKLTNESLARLACQYTIHSQMETNISMFRLYQMGHSPIRTQKFLVELIGVPHSVAMHLVRHTVGIEHFIQTFRPDRGASVEQTRATPQNHMFICNAESLINMARKRLCFKTSPETNKVMFEIRNEVDEVDPDLAYHMVPECVYRGRICHEAKMCGKVPHVRHISDMGDGFV